MEEVRLQEELQKTRHELLLLYEIGNLIRKALLLDEVVYLILSAITSHEGLGYNRAMLFMVDDRGTTLEGCMGIGPTHPETSSHVWKMIEDKKITLEGLLDVYHKANKKIDIELNSIVKEIRLPIEKSFGVLPKTVINDEPCHVTQDEARHELCDMRLINLGISDFMVVPLRGRDRVIGVLVVDNISTKKEITHEDIRTIMMLANHAGLALENAKQYNEVVITAQQDSLTKLWNHGHFQKILQEAVKDAYLKEKSLSLVVFDVDDFKSYNDAYGHQIGDKVLENISRIAKTVMRRMDNLARYGGEEFVAVLPGTTKSEAVKLAERLRSAIEHESAVSVDNGVSKKVTVSVGVASFPEDAEDKDKLLFCADGALYEAKRTGKNCVKAYRRPPTR